MRPEAARSGRLQNKESKLASLSPANNDRLPVYFMDAAIDLVRVQPDKINNNISAQLEQALALNASIFSPSKSKFTSVDSWTTRLRDSKGALCLALQGNTAVGFMLVYRKQWPSESQLDESWHIWLCGVASEARGQRLLGRLFDCAKEDKSGLWSVNTFEERFGSMVHWLKGNGWDKICEYPEGKSTWVRTVQ